MKNVEYIERLLSDIELFNGELDQGIMNIPQDTDPDAVLEKAFGTGMNREKIVKMLEKHVKEENAGENGRKLPLVMQMIEELCGDPLGQFLP